MFKRRTLLLSSFLALSTAFGGEIDSSKKAVVPVTENDQWVFMLAIPGWAAGVSGDVGLGKFVSYASVSPGKIIQSIDMAASLRGEVSKGRFGLMGDFLYLSLSNSMGTDTMVKKVDLRVDETIGQLAARWRLIENQRGSFDVYGGVRYMSVYEQASLQPNPERINERSAELVDAVGDRLRTGISNSGLRQKIAEILRPEINPLLGRNPSLPVAPLHGALRDELRNRIAQIVGGRRDELIAAIRELDAAATAELRARAQSRVNGIKQDLTKKIARVLESKIDRTASLNYWWLDPFIGLRGRYNLSPAWYLTGRGDVGGFGLGTEFSWQVEGALGCQITRSIFAEAGYRALGIDYTNDNIINNTITHGAQLTIGVIF